LNVETNCQSLMDDSWLPQKRFYMKLYVKVLSSSWPILSWILGTNFDSLNNRRTLKYTVITLTKYSYMRALNGTKIYTCTYKLQNCIKSPCFKLCYLVRCVACSSVWIWSTMCRMALRCDGLKGHYPVVTEKVLWRPVIRSFKLFFFFSFLRVGTSEIRNENVLVPCSIS
jgi:hypothetical protein